MSETHTETRAATRDLVAAIDPLDDTEVRHRAQVLDWIDSGAPLWRTAKPATPPMHLASYAVVIGPALEHALFVDHRIAGRWLPAGGHNEPGEHPATTAQALRAPDSRRRAGADRPSTPARTMAPSCAPSRLAGPGAPSGMSKKWRRSQTNTRPKVAAPRGEKPRSASSVITAVATTEGVPTSPGDTCCDTFGTAECSAERCRALEQDSRR